MITPLSGGKPITGEDLLNTVLGGKKNPEKKGEENKAGKEFVGGQIKQLQGTASDTVKEQQAATNKSIAQAQTTPKDAVSQVKNEPTKSSSASATEKANKQGLV